MLSSKFLEVSSLTHASFRRMIISNHKEIFVVKFCIDLQLDSSIVRQYTSYYLITLTILTLSLGYSKAYKVKMHHVISNRK